MRCEVIGVGTELLLGQIVNTNAAWIGQRLADVGWDCLRHTVVGDNEGRSHREAPESDGAVRVEGVPGRVRVGQYLPVEVTAAQGPELLARIAG